MNARADSVSLASQRAAGLAKRRAAFAVMSDLLRLTKPRITAMVIVTSLGGMWLAARSGSVAQLDLGTALWALLGLVLVVGGANALNMYLERETDGLMARTANRPLPAGRLEPAVALWFGVALAVIAIPLLAFLVNVITAFLAAISLALYVLAYTPLKRVTSRALLIGAIPGAMPPLLGWTAATGTIEWPGVALFAVLFFWQLPHFIAIATFRRREYAQAGIVVLPAERGDYEARCHGVIYAIALLAVSLVLVPLGVCGPIYFASATVLGGAFLILAIQGLSRGARDIDGGVRWARRLFVASLVYLPLLVAAIMLGG